MTGGVEHSVVLASRSDGGARWELSGEPKTLMEWKEKFIDPVMKGWKLESSSPPADKLSSSSTLVLQYSPRGDKVQTGKAWFGLFYRLNLFRTIAPVKVWRLKVYLPCKKFRSLKGGGSYREARRPERVPKLNSWQIYNPLSSKIWTR